jgi:ADP-ribose pyrophosphatase
MTFGDDKNIKWEAVGEPRKQSTNPYHSQLEKHYTLPNGKKKVAYTGHHKPFAIGMALTKDMDIILVREYRPGPDKIMIDMPCGSMNEGEDPKAAMLRELEEETGYTGQIELVNETFTGPYSDQKRFTFLIRDCVKVGPQKLDHDEFIEVVTMPLSEFVHDWVLSGETTNAAAVIYCLDYLDMLEYIGR